MTGTTKLRPNRIVLDMTGFPPPEDRAAREAGFVPAAGFALVPPVREPGKAPARWGPLALLFAAGAGAYQIFRSGRGSGRR